jgi:hypothetical protein
MSPAPVPVVITVLFCSTTFPVNVTPVPVVVCVPFVWIVPAVTACAPLVVTLPPNRAVVAELIVIALNAVPPPIASCKSMLPVPAVSSNVLPLAFVTVPLTVIVPAPVPVVIEAFAESVTGPLRVIPWFAVVNMSPPS